MLIILLPSQGNILTPKHLTPPPKRAKIGVIKLINFKHKNMSTAKKFFRDASPKLMLLWGILMGIAIIVIIGGTLALVGASKAIDLSGSLADTISNSDSIATTFTVSQKSDKPVMKFFVMSFCPYGQQAEQGITPVARLLQNQATLEPHFVIYSNYQGGGPTYCLDKDSKYCSMHGVSEVNEDVRQLCIWKYDQAKWFDYVEALNGSCSATNVDTCWEGVAKNLKIDTAKIKKCFDSEAETLLAQEVALNTQYGVQGSPQIFINDEEYSGGRDPESYKQAICSGFNTVPDACQQTLDAGTGAAAGSCN